MTSFAKPVERERERKGKERRKTRLVKVMKQEDFKYACVGVCAIFAPPVACTCVIWTKLNQREGRERDAQVQVGKGLTEDYPNEEADL